MIIALGTAGFAALGLLLGGTLRAEIVLAVANLLWFVFAGLGALTLEGGIVAGGAADGSARLTPSGALTEALTQAMTLSVDWFGIAVLAAWGARGGAVRAALVPLHLTKRAAAADTPADPTSSMLCLTQARTMSSGNRLAHDRVDRLTASAERTPRSITVT